MDEHPLPASDEPADPPARRRFPIALVVSFVVTLAVLPLAAGGVLYLATGSIPGVYTDPGIRMCEALRERKGLSPTGSEKKWTESDYRHVRGAFADSHHDDIREAGTKMVDAFWQLNGLGAEDGIGGALVLAGPLLQNYSALAGACANHGVVLPRVLADAAAADPAPSPSADTPSPSPSPSQAPSPAPSLLASRADTREPRTYEAVQATVSRLTAAYASKDGARTWDLLTSSGQATISQEDYSQVVRACSSLFTTEETLSISLNVTGTSATITSVDRHQGTFDWQMVYERGRWKHQPSDGAMAWMKLGPKSLQVLRSGGACD